MSDCCLNLDYILMHTFYSLPLNKNLRHLNQNNGRYYIFGIFTSIWFKIKNLIFANGQCSHSDLDVPKKLTVLACLTMSKLKMNQHVPNKSTDLLKKIGLMGTVLMGHTVHLNFITNGRLTRIEQMPESLTLSLSKVSLLIAVSWLNLLGK